MTAQQRNIVRNCILFFLLGIGIYIYFIFDRIELYVANKRFPPSPMPQYVSAVQEAPQANVDLGFISFFLELSPQSTIKEGKGCVIIKDPGRSLLITVPIIESEEPLPIEADELRRHRSILNNHGTLVRADQAASTLDVDLSVLFCSTAEFENQKTLMEMRIGQGLIANPMDRREFYSSSAMDAIISRSERLKVQEIYWSTKAGPAEEQMSGVINLIHKGDTSNGKWRDQFIRSLVVHDKSKRITPAEMAARLEKIKQPPK